MEVFKLFGTLGIKTKQADEALDSTTQKARKAKEELAWGKKVDASIISAGNNILKVGGILGGVAVAAGTFALKGGISRALNIEDAQAKLKGLGHSQDNVSKIMENALASVKGTAFGLDAAATTAANAVAAGIKPGEQLEGVLKTVANSAAIAGTDMGSMGAIFNKVSASNKLQMDSINQLHDAGIPALQFVAKELGVTAEEASKMASAGEIDFATFERAMRVGVGDAAVEMGKTTRGAWANMQAAASRVGAAVVKDIIPKVRELFVGFTNWLDDNSDAIVGYANGFINGFKRVVNFISSNRETLKTIAVMIGTLLIPAVARYIQLQLIAGAGAVAAGAKMAAGWIMAMGPMGAVIAVVAALLYGIQNTSGGIQVAMAIAAGAITLFTVAVLASKIQLGILAVQVAALGIAQTVSATATKVVTAAQWLWNAAMAANPIGLVIAAVAGLAIGIGALVMAFNSEKAAQDRLKTAQEGHKTAVDNLKTANDNLKTAQDNLTSSSLNAEGAALRVERAQLAYNDAVEQYGPESLEAREASFNLKQSQNDLEAANDSNKEATDELKNKQAEQKEAAKESKKKTDELKKAQDDLKDSQKPLGQRIGETWSGIKSKVSDANTFLGNKFNDMKTKAGKIFDKAKSEAGPAWDNIKSKATSKMNDIKNFFSGMKFSWPRIPMPSFSVSPAGWKIGDLVKGSIPKLGVSFHAKGGIMNNPSAFGMNGNNLMVGGEAGPEAILPLTREVLGKIGDGIASTMQSGHDTVILEALLHEIKQLREEQKELEVKMDSGALVGAISKKMDKALEGNANLRRRGVTP